MGGIFISYRREDSGPYAGRLRDTLSNYFGAEQVFRVIDRIEVGGRSPRVIERAVGSCDALLALIGPTWLAAKDEAGRRRLDDPNDHVRLEIATALGSSDVLVIPVLVGPTSMPARADLPKPLAALAECKAVPITDESWDDQVARLTRALEEVVAPRVVAPLHIAEPEAEQLDNRDEQHRQGIFLCYRHDDSESETGRLADALTLRFGDSAVFMDVDRLRPGNWRKQIDQFLDDCAAVVVVIGPQWLEALKQRSRGDDQVRYEIAQALQLDKIIIPVTVGRAQLPPRSNLPDDIAALNDAEAYELIPGRLWKPAVRALLDDLDHLLRGAAPKVVATEPGAGATVPPGPFKLKVTFDQKMMPNSYSFVTLPDDTFPPCQKKPTISADGMSYSLDCTLEAGMSYALGFNGGDYMNFKNKAGVAAAPSELHFSTTP